MSDAARIRTPMVLPSGTIFGGLIEKISDSTLANVTAVDTTADLLLEWDGPGGAGSVTTSLDLAGWTQQFQTIMVPLGRGHVDISKVADASRTDVTGATAAWAPTDLSGPLPGMIHADNYYASQRSSGSVPYVTYDTFGTPPAGTYTLKVPFALCHSSFTTSAKFVVKEGSTTLQTFYRDQSTAPDLSQGYPHMGTSWLLLGSFTYGGSAALTVVLSDNAAAGATLAAGAVRIERKIDRVVPEGATNLRATLPTGWASVSGGTVAPLAAAAVAQQTDDTMMPVDPDAPRRLKIGVNAGAIYGDRPYANFYRQFGGWVQFGGSDSGMQLDPDGHLFSLAGGSRAYGIFEGISGIGDVFQGSVPSSRRGGTYSIYFRYPGDHDDGTPGPDPPILELGSGVTNGTSYAPAGPSDPADYVWVPGKTSRLGAVGMWRYDVDVTMPVLDINTPNGLLYTSQMLVAVGDGTTRNNVPKPDLEILGPEIADRDNWNSRWHPGEHAWMADRKFACHRLLDWGLSPFDQATELAKYPGPDWANPNAPTYSITGQIVAIYPATPGTTDGDKALSFFPDTISYFAIVIVEFSAPFAAEDFTAFAFTGADAGVSHADSLGTGTITPAGNGGGAARMSATKYAVQMHWEGTHGLTGTTTLAAPVTGIADLWTSYSAGYHAPWQDAVDMDKDFNTDTWQCFPSSCGPSMATDYVTAAAARMGPGLKLYIELDNEEWSPARGYKLEMMTRRARYLSSHPDDPDYNTSARWPVADQGGEYRLGLAHQVAEFGKAAVAAWIAAGRRRDDIVIILGCQAVFATQMDWSLGQLLAEGYSDTSDNTPIDAICIAWYQSVVPNPIDDRIAYSKFFEHVDNDGVVDAFNLTCDAGQLEYFAKLHRDTLDSKDFRSVKILGYEGGTERLFPFPIVPAPYTAGGYDRNVMADSSARCHAVAYNPRMGRAMFHFVQSHVQPAGFELANVFTLGEAGGDDSPGISAFDVAGANWHLRRYIGELPGVGDGTDGLTDNRTNNFNPIDFLNNVSPIGRAMIDFNAGPTVPPATNWAVTGPTTAKLNVASPYSLATNGDFAGEFTVAHSGAAGSLSRTSLSTTRDTFNFLPTAPGVAVLSFTNDGGLTNPSPIRILTPPTVPNGGFEAPVLTPGTYATAPAGCVWNGVAISTGTGIGHIGALAEGLQYAFLYGTASFDQDIDFEAGTYKVTFQAGQRNDFNAADQDIAVDVDGLTLLSITPGGAFSAHETPTFYVAAGTHNLRLRGLASNGPANTALVDAVSLSWLAESTPATGYRVDGPTGSVVGGTTTYLIAFDGAYAGTVSVALSGTTTGTLSRTGLSASVPTFDFTATGPGIAILTFTNGGGLTNPSAISVIVPGPVPNGGFEAPSVGAGNYATAPSGCVWNGVILATKDSAFDSVDVPTDGVQYAVIYGTGTFDQDIALDAGTYAVRFLAAQRNFSQAGNDFAVDIDGDQVGTATPGPHFAEYTTPPFTVAAGTHNLRFRGLDTRGTTDSALVDAVRLIGVAGPVQAATTYAIGVASAGTVGATMPVNVSLDHPGTATVTLTPTGGTLSASTVAFASEAGPKAVVFTPTVAGTATITATNDGGLSNPSARSIAVSAPTPTPTPTPSPTPTSPEGRGRRARVSRRRLVDAFAGVTVTTTITTTIAPTTSTTKGAGRL